MNIQPILNIAEICSQKGIRNVVISPGSRSAPITLGFANHSKINCKIVNDERSASFIAMGMSLQLNETVAIVCTSGTAALNYAPAIAEAYYQQISLLVITADRPPELIDQQDGQCLRQFEIFKNYIKGSYQTPDTLKEDTEIEEFYSTIDHAINEISNSPLGPVHINVPIREPFYPEKNVEYRMSNFEFRSEKEINQITTNFKTLIAKINNTNKILFIAGQQRYDNLLQNQINQLSNQLKYPVITDINSNLSHLEGVIQMEEIIFQNELNDLHPELVITFGNSILSKKLKLYFRANKIEHYHIAETNPTPNFFKQLTGSIQCRPVNFFNDSIVNIDEGNFEFYNLWKDKNSQLSTLNSQLLSNCEFSEPFIVNQLFNTLSENSHLHLANSMAVRWANMVNITKEFTIQSNRGVSGIDGSTSTALGYSITSDKPNFLITGDIAFFYDRNAFWNNYIPNNFKVIILNNHEGGIFNMIPGPSNNEETLSYFTSSQNLTAESLANEFNLDYFFVENKEELYSKLEDFLTSSKCSILELKTNSKVNKQILNSLKKI